MNFILLDFILVFQLLGLTYTQTFNTLEECETRGRIYQSYYSVPYLCRPIPYGGEIDLR